MGLALALLVGAPLPAAAKARRPQVSRKPTAPTIQLEHLTTHAHYALRADAGGGFSTRKLRELSQLLRCHHTGKRHSISERLIEILYATARHYHNAKLLIVAGYRAPQVALQKGNPRSPHKRGVACDFQVAGVANEAVRDYLQKTYHRIGLGYYPRAGFVHLDVGRKRDAYWIDYSGPGEPARYGQKNAAAPTEPRDDSDPAASAPTADGSPEAS
jgi:uncharacterized protein YcbK (DUF882 family)